jgi:hypothetical protein
MAIDVRAVVTCSLGTLISGNIADGYIQGQGLVLVRGSVEISGLITPAVGTAVTFAYKVNGGTRSIPRKLRVLSSFADPFRRTTKVELGCKLTYLSDLREKLKWTAFEDPQNEIDFEPADADVVTLPVRASSMMAKCLTELGMTAASSPLTNIFSRAQYDFSAGWVSVLNDLLISECRCGYLDFNEVLQIFSLNQDGGTGRVVTSSDIINIGAINAGQLPGEAVTVSYSTLRMKGEASFDDWSKSQSSDRSSVTISYISPSDGITRLTATYGTLDTTEEFSDFQTLKKASDGIKVNVMRYRKVIKTESSAKVLGSVMKQFLENGISASVTQLTTTTEEWFYYDAEGNEVRNVRETYASQAYAYGSVSLPMVFDSGTTKTAVSIPYGSTYLQEATETLTTIQGTLRKVITYKYGTWDKTIGGQQAIAEGRDSFTSTGQVESYISQLISGKFLLSIDIHTEESTSSSQRVPFGSEYLNQRYAKGGNPNNGYRGSSETKLALALGSATAQRRTEFTLPLAPDDSWMKISAGNYSIVTSAALENAKAYGRIQNRLLLANRSGMNLQLAATQMPETPFSPLVVQANGLSGLYRTNGTSWTLSQEGIVVSTDALFWGAVGGTGSFWFPVAPGVTTLPTTPATSTANVTGTADGGGTVTIATVTTMAVPGVVMPYNETVIAAQTTYTRLVVSSYPYSLATSTTSLALTAHTKLVLILPPTRVSGTAAPVLGAGQVSPTSTATGDGWSLIYNNTDDEASIETASFPFSVTVDSTAYTSAWVTSNSYVTFVDTEVKFSSLSANNPAAPKIHIGAADFSYQRVYTKSSSNAFRIRWEGNSAYGAPAGTSDRFFELTFYKPLGSGTQFIEVRSGDITGSTGGPFMLATASTALASGTFAANESWVFEGNSSGTSWTIYTGEHVEAS